MANGWLALKLLKQVRRPEHHQEVSRHLIRAAFDLGFAAQWSRTAPHLRIEENPRLTWRIGAFTYVYLPDVNDRALHDWAERTPRAATTVILTPVGMCDLFNYALEKLLGNRTPTVMSIYSHITLRIFFSSADAKWTREDTVWEYLNCYNTRVEEADARSPLRIRLPRDPLS